MSFFQLTDTHIRNGRLTAEDFAAYAGFQVAVFDLSKLPHKRKQINDSIPENQLMERANVFWAAITGSGLDRVGYHSDIAAKAAKLQAGYYFALAKPMQANPEECDAPFRFNAPNPGSTAKKPNSVLMVRDNKIVVIPGVLEERIKPDILWSNFHAIVCQAHYEDEQEIWSYATGIPAANLIQYPQNRYKNLKRNIVVQVRYTVICAG